MKKIAIIFAGGIGKRMNQKALPKQFLKLHGREIIIHTLEHFQQHEEIDGIVISCVREWISFLQKLLVQYRIDKVKSVVPGGETGQESIYLGLKEAEKYFPQDSIVLIHDGVRPLIEESTIRNCIHAVMERGTGITVAPVTETVIQVTESEVENVINRSNCLLARAPQGFVLKDIMQAHEKAREEGLQEFIDSATLMKWAGYDLTVVEGPIENIKITTPVDFFTFKALVELKENSDLFGE